MTGQKYKMCVVAALIAGACSSMYYFRAFLGTCTVVAHIFYIPIVLASFWWRRKGLIVAVFSSAFLILSHVFLRPNVALINDYSYAVMFLVVSFVVGWLSERIAKDKNLLQSTNQKLQAREQQAGAANQQLDARNQQLRAANEQLAAEEAELRQTHDFLDRLIDYANAPIIVWDPKFRVTRFNGAFEHMTGYTADEVVGQELNIFFPKASRNESLENIKRTLRGEYWESVEIPVLCKDGDIRVALWNSANVYAEDDTTLLATIAQGQDITKRKGAQEALQTAYDQLQASEQQLRAANQQLAATNQQLVSSEQQLKAANQQLIASEQQLRASNQQLTATNQQLQAEVAERRRVEKVLAKSEKRFRQLFDNMSSGVAVYEAIDEGRDFVFVDFNRAGERIEGIKRKDLIGKSVLDVFPGVKDFGLFDVFEKVWRTGEPEHYPVSLYKDERIAGWRENYVYKLPSGEIVVVYDDITERKQAEEQLRRTRTELEHTSRLVTAGEMASGIAHELNQPLCAILNYANVVLRAVKTKGIEQDQLTEILADIAAQADRAGEIIRRLRNLVKKSEPRQSSVNVNEIVKEVVKLNQAEALEQGIEVLTELAEDIQSVMADNIQVQQVVLNLVRNGFQAMTQTPREKRRLTIRTTAGDSGWIEVAVCDSGKGLSQKTAERMFDSFFSTRDDGLGVGLSLCRSIIEVHGGKIWAEPNADCGATVRFTLPVKGAKNG